MAKKPALPWLPPSGSSWWLCEKGHVVPLTQPKCGTCR